MTPTGVVLPAVRSKEKIVSGKRLPQVLPIPAPEYDLSLKLKVGPVSGDQVTLSVEVINISSQQPLNRVRVSLQNSKNVDLESDLTRENGVVTFQNVEPGSYLVEVRYEGKILELPIILTPAQGIPDTESEDNNK